MIEFVLSHAGYVSLKIYNVLGEDIATLTDGEHAAGTFKATWDASGMPSGVYFYRLTAGEYVQTKKAVLMRYLLWHRNTTEARAAMSGPFVLGGDKLTG